MFHEDISAMKVNAIVNSGQRLKDFIDYYCFKYPDVDPNTAKTSLLYHNDIDFSVPIKLTDRKLKWADIQRSISKAITEIGI